MAGPPVTVAMPDDTPRAFVDECRHYGAEVHLVPGTIAEAGRFLRERAIPSAFEVSTLREPFRIEGKKTMAYEIFELLGGELPNVIVYPAGGGTDLVGMWKALDEMQALGGLADGVRRPRFVSVQAAGCAPVVKAFDQGAPAPNPGLRQARAPMARLGPIGVAHGARDPRAHGAVADPRTSMMLSSVPSCSR